MEAIETFVDDPRVPPVPRNFKIYQLEDGRFFTCSPPDKRKSRARVPKEPARFFLVENVESNTLRWVPENDYNTRPIRELMLKQGLEMEIKFNMKMTSKAPKATTIIRQEYGMTGTPLALYVQFCRFTGQQMKPDVARMAMEKGELT